MLDKKAIHLEFMKAALQANVNNLSNKTIRSKIQKNAIMGSRSLDDLIAYSALKFADAALEAYLKRWEGKEK